MEDDDLIIKDTIYIVLKKEQDKKKVLDRVLDVQSAKYLSVLDVKEDSIINFKYQKDIFLYNIIIGDDISFSQINSVEDFKNILDNFEITDRILKVNYQVMLL